MVKMSQSSQSRVQVTIELGHTACIRKKPTPEGFTHDWSVFVRGPDGSKIQHFIEKVVFNLHDTFNKPKRTVKEPPYQVSESGYASFLLPIDIYFRNKELPKKISFQYDLYLNAEGGPPINHTRCEKLTFQNPTEEFRQKLLKAGGVQFTSSNSQQPFTELFGTPITPDTGNKRPAGSSSSGKDKSTKGKSSSKPSTPQSSHAASTVVYSSSSSMGGPATQPIASKEPKTSKSSSSSSSSTRETTGQKRPSISSPEQTSGKKMKRSSSTSSTTESSSSKHKSHKSSSKKKSDSEKSSKRKSSSSKHHKDKSEHKEKKKKDKSESSGSHSKSSSSLSRSMPELKLKTELLSPLHDSPPRSLSPPHTKTDILDSNSDSDSNFSPKHIPPSPKDSPISSLSEDEEEMTRKILAGKAEDDSSSNSSKSYNEQSSVKPVSDSDSDSNDDVKSTHSETKSQSFSHMSPKVSKNSSDSHKLSPVKTESKSSPVKSESKSSKSKHGSSKKSSSSKSEPKSKDTKDLKDKKERSESSSSSKHSRSNKDSKTSKEKKDKESSQNENGIPEKAPNGESIKELLDLQVTLCRMTDRRKLQHVANLIGPTGLFKVTETSFSFDLCNLESDIVKKIKTVLSESLS